MAVAEESTARRPNELWKRARDAFVLPVSPSHQDANGASRRWNTVCSVFLPSRDSLEDSNTPPEVQPEEADEEAGRTNPLLGPSPSAHASEMMRRPGDETSQDMPMAAPHAAAENPTEDPATHATQRSAEAVAPTEPNRAAPAWGSDSEVDDLNKDIQECLEIEGVSTPASFFPTSVRSFPSVGHYYVEVMNRLDAAGIDLFESFVGHLGEDHPLVKDMKTLLPERMPSQTLLMREPTATRQERHELGRSMGVPGLPEFSDECRTTSWVIRTGERSVPPRDTQDQRRHVHGLSIIESVGGSSRRYPALRENGSVVCPLGDNSAYCPPGAHPCDPPPPPSSVTRSKKSQSTVWERFRSCFCFGAP